MGVIVVTRLQRRFRHCAVRHVGIAETTDVVREPFIGGGDEGFDILENLRLARFVAAGQFPIGDFGEAGAALMYP